MGEGYKLRAEGGAGWAGGSTYVVWCGVCCVLFCCTRYVAVLCLVWCSVVLGTEG